MRSVDWDRHSDDEKTKFFYRLKDEDQKTYGVCRIFSDYSHKKRSFAAIICGDCRRNEWDGKCHPIRIEICIVCINTYTNERSLFCHAQ